MEMEASYQYVGVRELNLGAYNPNSITDKIHAVPAIRTSAAFFTFLRANLVLNPSEMASNANTPQLEPSTSYYPMPSSPTTSEASSSILSSTPLVPIDNIPELSLETLDARDDKENGLRLVTESVAQMQQRAAVALIFHPLCLAGLGTILAAVWRFTRAATKTLAPAMLIILGLFVAYLWAIRYATSGYVNLAVDMDRTWLKAPDGEEDLLIGARRDGHLVGALVLRLQPNPGQAGKKRSRTLALRGGRGVIRAWTTDIKSRGMGIGKDMLRAAIRTSKERCGKDAEVGFAKEHANSVMLLPSIFSKAFKKDEVRATQALSDALTEWDAKRRRR